MEFCSCLPATTRAYCPPYFHVALQCFAGCPCMTTQPGSSCPLLNAVASIEGAHFMLSYMRDMLTYRTLGRIDQNADRAEDISSMAPRFTTGRINCIIESLANAMDRLSTNAPAAGTFTRLFTEITEEL